MNDARLAELYRAYGPTIYARCRRILGDAALAEDAMHETFLRVAKHLDRAPGPDAALTWIYRIATNYCLNALRDTKSHATPESELPERAGANLEAQLANADLARQLLAELPGSLRAVTWLVRVEGMEQAEAARVLDVSRRTVVSRLNEAQSRLTSRAKEYV